MRRAWSGCNFITGFLRIDFIDQCQDFLVTEDVAHAVTIIDKAHHCNAEMYCNDKFVELESVAPQNLRDTLGWKANMASFWITQCARVEDAECIFSARRYRAFFSVRNPSEVGKGDLEGYNITSLRHGAQFDVHTGGVTQMPAVVDIPAHPVQIRDGNIYLGIPKE